MKVVIVGGVAGGATAAARIRRLDESAEIVVFEKSGYISYANCGLPYYIGGVIEDSDDLTLQTPASFYSRFRVDMRVCHEVLAVDAAHKQVTVKNLSSGEVFVESYDKLILSTGATPVKPALPGADDDRIFTLRTVEDTMKIKSYVTDRHPARAVVIGGGFIGVEMAENLHACGIHVSLIEAADQVMAPFDSDMASLIHTELRQNGIQLLLGRKAESFQNLQDHLEVLLDDSQLIAADMVILAIGVKPDTTLAKSAGLALGTRDSIVVNDRMQTSQPDIYAVGDAVSIPHIVTGQPTLISLAGPANKQGRVAADVICGLDSRYAGGQGSSVLKMFDLTAASTGINERTARANGIDCDKVILSPMSHAGYYPGGKIMTMKVLFEKETYRLLGAQIIGYEGVDKRIDVLATALRTGLKAHELAELDLAYAPPYSSAKDPVNMAGFMVENIQNGLVKQWYCEDAEALPRDGSVTLLDTRTPGEYRRGHIEGFVNIPVDELRERLNELDKQKKVYVVCQSGLRSYIAVRILAGHGFDACHLAGGFRFYDAVTHDRALRKRATPCGMDE